MGSGAGCIRSGGELRPGAAVFAYSGTPLLPFFSIGGIVEWENGRDCVQERVNCLLLDRCPVREPQVLESLE